MKDNVFAAEAASRTGHAGMIELTNDELMLISGGDISDNWGNFLGGMQSVWAGAEHGMAMGGLVGMIGGPEFSALGVAAGAVYGAGAAIIAHPGH